MVRVQFISPKPQFNNFSRGTVPLNGSVTSFAPLFLVSQLYLGQYKQSTFVSQMFYFILQNTYIVIEYGVSDKLDR